MGRSWLGGGWLGEWWSSDPRRAKDIVEQRLQAEVEGDGRVDLNPYLDEHGRIKGWVSLRLARRPYPFFLEPTLRNLDEVVEEFRRALWLARAERETEWILGAQEEGDVPPQGGWGG